MTRGVGQQTPSRLQSAVELRLGKKSARQLEDFVGFAQFFDLTLQVFDAGALVRADAIAHTFIDFMLSKIPMGRLGKVDEVSNLVCWLASEECSFSTGAVFDVSGGRATY